MAPFEAANVEEQYEKDKNLKREVVESVLEWANEQPHLPTITELEALLAVYSCNYDIEHSKTVIDNYCTMRTAYTDLFEVPDEATIRDTMRTSTTVILPQLTPDGYVVLLSKITDPNPANFDHLNFLKVNCMVTTLHMYQTGIVNGILIIVDLSNLGIAHVPKINFGAVKKLLYFSQEAVFVKMKGMHFLNVMSVCCRIVSCCKPFLKKEFYQMIVFHSKSSQSLYQYVPKECLPKDYGGEAPPMSVLGEKSFTNIVDNLDFLRYLQSRKVDESKRPKRQEHGNWRNLWGNLS